MYFSSSSCAPRLAQRRVAEIALDPWRTCSQESQKRRIFPLEAILLNNRVVAGTYRSG